MALENAFIIQQIFHQEPNSLLLLLLLLPQTKKMAGRDIKLKSFCFWRNKIVQ